jgi:hypothetical protein
MSAPTDEATDILKAVCYIVTARCVVRQPRGAPPAMSEKPRTLPT